MRPESIPVAVNSSLVSFPSRIAEEAREPFDGLPSIVTHDAEVIEYPLSDPNASISRPKAIMHDYKETKDDKNR